MMPEGYTDKALLEWVERAKATAEIGYGDARVPPAVERIMRERDEARAAAKWLARMVEERLCDVDPCPFITCATIRTAIAYPDTRPNVCTAFVPETADPTDTVDT
jgi:hypothetical protein